MGLFRKSYDQLDDVKLVRLASEGSEAAFSELYDRYAPQLMGYFFRMLWKDRELAEDYTQDLFIKVANNLGHFDHSKVFKTWIFSIANNMCKNAYRSAEVRSRSRSYLEQEQQTMEEPMIQRALDQDQFNQALELALGALDGIKQSTFRMRYFEDLSIKEISEAMECSEGTVKSRLFYVTKHLSEVLKGYKHLMKRH